MLQPKRHDERHPKPKRHHWHCAECAADLGTIRRHHQGGPVLFPGEGFAGLMRAKEPGTFRLLCTAGHWTTWQGSGIKWFVNSEQEAA